MIVSDSLWYPLWDRSQVESTTQRLAKLIGDQYKIGGTTSGAAAATVAGAGAGAGTAPLQGGGCAPGSPTQSDSHASPSRALGGAVGPQTPTRPADYPSALALTGGSINNNFSNKTNNNPNNSNNNNSSGVWDEPSAVVPPGYTMIPQRDLHLFELWELLTKPRNQLPSAASKMPEIFEELGIENAASLVECKEEDLQRLAECLKKIPRALFFSKLNHL